MNEKYCAEMPAASSCVQRLGPNGAVTTVAGTGSLAKHRDGIAATRAGILPSDIAEFTRGALLVTQTEPVAAVRVIDRAGKITTLVR